MSSSRKWSGLAIVLWILAMAVGWVGPLAATDVPLPDPFLRESSPLISIAVAAILTAIVIGVLRWFRRPPEPRDEARHEPDGPRVVALHERRNRRRPPRFYEDLRRRETMLENLEDRTPDRPVREVVELPDAERNSDDERD